MAMPSSSACLKALPQGRALAGLHRRLLNWFDQHHRPLPWRLDRDPYRIWVSEVMLQQTTVAAATAYFERFVNTFPTYQALAAADEQHILKLWEGLGYYRRARHLHAAARTLAADYQDQLPDDPLVWSSLPGVGRYILGAVLSQSFDRKLPIVEANSLRVLSRLLGYRGDPRAGEGTKLLWKTAEALLPNQRVGDFNQALMELGSLVCLPARPLCQSCPLASNCQARRRGIQDKIPLARPKAAVESVEEVASIVRKGTRILLCQRRPDSGRWQNMWEVPHGTLREGEDPLAAAVRLARELTGLDVEPRDQVLTLQHTITRYRIKLVCVECQWRGGRFASSLYSTSEWLASGDLDRHPVSSPQRQLMKFLAAGRSGQ